jgi:hypothetical protein
MTDLRITHDACDNFTIFGDQHDYSFIFLGKIALYALCCKKNSMHITERCSKLTTTTMPE